jgi:hypothetical protein
MRLSVPHSEHFQVQNPAITVPPHDALEEGYTLKKVMLAVAVFLFAVLMVLPVVRSVNLSAGKPVTIDGMQYADGWPMPPPIPPKPPSINANVFVADGWPMPPPIPPKPPQSRMLA